MQNRQFLADCVAQAHRIIMTIYRQDFSVSYKGKTDPVTQADKEADAFYISRLSRRFPGMPILTEESHQAGTAYHDAFWCIDPLDGTKDFIQKDDEFATMLARIEDSRPVEGIIGLPAKDIMLYAAKGEGCFIWRQGAWHAFEPVNRTFDGRTAAAIHTRNHQSQLLFDILDRLGIVKRLARGSVGYKTAAMLLGMGDICVYPSQHTKWWDSAPGEIILSEAGGGMTDLFGAPIVYQGKDVYNRKGLVASLYKEHRFLTQIADLVDTFA